MYFIKLFNLKMDRVLQKQRCDHPQSIKGSSKYDIKLSFCPKYQRQPHPPQHTFPQFNQDRKYFTAAFILGIEKRVLIKNEQQQIMDHQKQIRQSLEKNNQLIFPRPNSKHTMCSVCKEHYKNYYVHIYSSEHRERISISSYNDQIKSLCEIYIHLWEGAEERADKQQQRLERQFYEKEQKYGEKQSEEIMPFLIYRKIPIKNKKPSKFEFDPIPINLKRRRRNQQILGSKKKFILNNSEVINQSKQNEQDEIDDKFQNEKSQSEQIEEQEGQIKDSSQKKINTAKQNEKTKNYQKQIQRAKQKERSRSSSNSSSNSESNQTEKKYGHAKKNQNHIQGQFIWKRQEPKQVYRQQKSKQFRYDRYDQDNRPNGYHLRNQPINQDLNRSAYQYHPNIPPHHIPPHPSMSQYLYHPPSYYDHHYGRSEKPLHYAQDKDKNKNYDKASQYYPQNPNSLYYQHWQYPNPYYLPQNPQNPPTQSGKQSLGMASNPYLGNASININFPMYMYPGHPPPPGSLQGMNYPIPQNSRYPMSMMVPNPYVGYQYPYIPPPPPTSNQYPNKSKAEYQAPYPPPSHK